MQCLFLPSSFWTKRTGTFLGWKFGLMNPLVHNYSIWSLSSLNSNGVIWYGALGIRTLLGSISIENILAIVIFVGSGYECSTVAMTLAKNVVRPLSINLYTWDEIRFLPRFLPLLWTEILILHLSQSRTFFFWLTIRALYIVIQSMQKIASNFLIGNTTKSFNMESHRIEAKILLTHSSVVRIALALVDTNKTLLKSSNIIPTFSTRPSLEGVCATRIKQH